MGLKEKYSGNDNYGKPKMDFVGNLLVLTDKNLLDQCEHFIWLSAYAANNSRSDYHWKCDACYDVCFLKRKLDIYKKAYENIEKTL